MRPWHTSSYLLIGFVVLTAGCSGEKPPVETAEVSGQITFRGDPLPGGQVAFVTADGETVKSAIIDENGNYKIEAPVGDVKITVNNELLKERSQKMQREHILRRPGAQQPTQLKGRYVALPTRYYTPGKTPLTYTVQKGQQTHNITMK
jgi:hypothetical protein